MMDTRRLWKSFLKMFLKLPIFPGGHEDAILGVTMLYYWSMNYLQDIGLPEEINGCDMAKPTRQQQCKILQTYL